MNSDSEKSCCGITKKIATRLTCRWPAALSILLLTSVLLAAGGVATAQVTDQYEDNDSPDNAPTLESGTYTGLSAEADGEDYYAVNLEPGQEISAHISYDGSVAEPTLEIVEYCCGTVRGVYVIETAEDVPDMGGNLSVGEEVTSSQYSSDATYMIRVTGGDTSVSYNLTIDVGEDTTAGATDQFEPDNSPEIASTLESGTYTDLTAEAEQQDYFAVDVSSGEELSAHISYDESVGEPTLEIMDTYDTTGAPYVTETATGINGNASVGEGFDSDGTYYVRVTGGDSSVSYDLTIDVSENGTAGSIDQFEPNNSPETASILGNGEYQNLFVADDSADYFEVSVRDNEEISAHISYDELTAHPELGIYDEDGTQVASVNSADGSDSVGYHAESSGTFYVGVIGGEEDIRYNLTVDVGENGTAGAVDRFEPNNDQDTASQVEPGTFTNLVAENGETDYYAVPVESGNVFSARLTFDPTEGEAGLALYGDDGSELEQINSSDATGEDILNASINTGGTYYVAVTGSDADVEYDLTISASESGLTPEQSTDTSTTTTTATSESGTTSGSGPGFGITVTIIGILSLAIIAHRKSI